MSNHPPKPTPSAKPAVSRVIPPDVVMTSGQEMRITAGSPATIRNLIRLTTAAVATAFFAVVVAGGAVYVANKKIVSPIGITDSGMVIPLVPLDQHHVDESRVIGFAGECLRVSFAHAFTTYRDSMSRASRCYTGPAWRDFSQAVDPLLAEMVAARMNMAGIVRPPGIIQSGKLPDGTFAWKFSTVIQLSMEGQSKRTTPKEYEVTGFVLRVPLTESVEGIRLGQVVLKAYVPPNGGTL